MTYSPLAMAKDECANWDNGRCLGLTADSLIPKPGVPRQANPLDHCILADNARCDYFERIVLPLANHGNPRFLQAREAYFGSKALRTAGAPDPRQCPECGNPLASGRQLCDDCKRKHRTASFKREKQRQRGQA